MYKIRSAADLTGLDMFAVAGLNVDETEAGNFTGHVTVQLSLPPSAFNKIKTPVYWEPAADGQYI